LVSVCCLGNDDVGRDRLDRDLERRGGDRDACARRVTWLGLRKGDAAIRVSRSNAHAAERAAEAALESATIAREQPRGEHLAFDAASAPRLVVDGALSPRDGDASDGT